MGNPKKSTQNIILTNENQFLNHAKMKEKEITSFAETIPEMISPALHNQQLKIEVKKGFGEIFGQSYK
jgi:hypothetical protein